MLMISLIVAILAAISISLIVYLLLNTIGGEGRLEHRIDDRLEKIFKRKTSGIAARTQFSAIAGLQAILQRQKLSYSINQLLILSGWNIPLGVFILMDFLWGGIVFLIVQVVTGNPLPAIPAALIAAGIPYLVLVLKRTRYIEKFTVLFPDALLMMKGALGAGQGMQAAFQVVADEGPKPICSEFQRLVAEIKVGSTLDKALDSLYRRIQTIDFHLFVISINIQTEVGGNLVELFDSIERTIRNRISLAREVRVLSAQGKMSGAVLMLLPFFVFVAIRLTNPTYFDPLIEVELGRKVLLLAFGFQLFGSWLIHKITRYSPI